MRPLTLLALLACLTACSNDPDLGDTQGAEDATPDAVEETPDSATPEAEVPDTEAPDTSAGETIEADSGAIDTAVDSGAIDTAVDSGAIDTAVDSTTDSGTDTGKPDTSTPADTSTPPDTATPDTTPVDTCVVNACGGCSALGGTPGASCGTCGGKLACNGTEALKCEGSTSANACGGCGALSGTLGAACGTCGGKLACDGTEALKCEGSMPTNACGGCTVLGNTVGAACGTCGGMLACDGTEALKCTGSMPTNACGGCNVLGGTVGASCGTCGGGTLGCDGTTALKCNGATPTNACGGCTTLPGAVGGACGTCGGMFACDGANALKCNGSMPTNACGGCNVLTPNKGDPCGGKCGSATYECSGATLLACVDPVTTPAEYTECGFCAYYECAADKKSTSCKVWAAEGDGTVVSWDGTSTRFGQIDPGGLAILTHVTTNQRLLSIQLRIARQQSAGGTGGVTIAAYRGFPNALGTPLGSVYLARASVPTDDVGAPGFTTITWSPAPTTTLNSEPVTYLITPSGSEPYYLYGTATGSPTGFAEFGARSTSTDSYSSLAFVPAMVIRSHACF